MAPEAVNPPGMLPADQVEARLAAQEHQFRHDNTIVPLGPRPGESVEVWATSGAALPLERAAVFYTVDGSLPDLGAAELPMEIAEVAWDPRAGYLTRWRAVLPPQSAGTVPRYRIAGWRAGETRPRADSAVWAQDGQGFWFRLPPERGITTFAYRVEPPAQALPEWVREAVIYQVFLDRFRPDDPAGAFPAEADPQARHGGTLRGVTHALDYLQDLGVTCLWLSPLCSAETYHRYHITDLYSVDPALGSSQDLRELVDAAHALGMRVLLDLVPSHCSWHHPAFDAARRDPCAPTASWFTFEEWPDRYRTFLDAVPALPSFNTEDPGARAHIIGSAVRWLRDYGVDGFRLDHAIGPSMDFWVAFRSAIRAAAPGCFSVGEVTDTSDALRRYRGRLDGVLDFHLASALRLTFGTGAWGVERLDTFLDAHERYMASGPGRVSFLDNHDMNRFLFVAGGDARRLRLAALCQFTLEATPALYYGTEIGLSQRHDIAERDLGGDAEARRDMPWNSDQWDRDLLAFYRALLRLRRDQRALREGARRTLHLDAEAATYAYLRSTAPASPSLTGDAPDPPSASSDLPNPLPGDVLVAFNLSEQQRVLELPLAANGWTCLLATGAEPRLDAAQGHLTLSLAPYSGAALAKT